MQSPKNHERFLELGTVNRLTVALIGLGVIFTCLGLGEAVYRLAFFDFDGAKDRLPIEMLFGLAFAWVATKLVTRVYQHQMKTSARIKLICDRNNKISRAVDFIEPLPFPGHQQAIRVIRDEVERIQWELDDILPR
jgi:hypothetical protein